MALPVLLLVCFVGLRFVCTGMFVTACDATPSRVKLVVVRVRSASSAPSSGGALQGASLRSFHGFMFSVRIERTSCALLTNVVFGFHFTGVDIEGSSGWGGAGGECCQASPLTLLWKTGHQGTELCSGLVYEWEPVGETVGKRKLLSLILACVCVRVCVRCRNKPM